MKRSTFGALLLMLLALMVQARQHNNRLPVEIGPAGSPPQPALRAGFTTVALNSEFSKPQPRGWFGCLGSGAGHTWYAANEGGDWGAPVPCSTTGEPTRFNLVVDPPISKQVLDLTFLPGDITDSGRGKRHYTTIQTADDSQTSRTNPCCIAGVMFPSNYYAEAVYRVATTPFVPGMRIGGTWYGFWQAGQGVNPVGSRWNTFEVDHPEQHGEDPGLLGWASLDWAFHKGGGFFPYSDFHETPDWGAYHTFGVRSITDGNKGLELCSYVDGEQRRCLLTTLDSSQYAEKKFLILFAGLQCYYFPSVSADCINVPISSIYNCNGNVCVHTNSLVREQNFWPVWMTVTGVTGDGAAHVNGSWKARPINWSNGATDWVLTGSSFNGSPIGGMINKVDQLDMYVQRVSVWSCKDWQTSNCNISSLPH